MPAGIVGIIIICSVAIVNAWSAKRSLEDRGPEDVYQIPLVAAPKDPEPRVAYVREPVNVPAPELHTIADRSGVIPAQGDPWPNRPPLGPLGQDGD